LSSAAGHEPIKDMKNLFSVFGACLLMLPTISDACLHFPVNYKGNLREGLQEAFLFHDGGNAHLVIRTNLNADQFPKEIAWVLPFPSLPSAYEEINGPFFERIMGLMRNVNDGMKFGEARGGGVAKGAKSATNIKVHQLVEAGSYQIQPIEILNDQASQELTDWLKKNKFNPMPANLQKPYLKKGAAFLAIRMQMDHPGGELRSKSLHVTYKADNLSLPIRFTHEKRTFDLDLYVFADKEIKKDLSQFHLNWVDSAAYENKGLMPFVDAVIGKRNGVFSLYQARGLNTPTKKLSKLSADPSF
jgi:hypothetical protein